MVLWMDVLLCTLLSTVVVKVGYTSTRREYNSSSSFGVRLFFSEGWTIINFIGYDQDEIPTYEYGLFGSLAFVEGC
jgi:hypothetical protein